MTFNRQDYLKGDYDHYDEAQVKAAYEATKKEGLQWNIFISTYIDQIISEYFNQEVNCSVFDFLPCGVLINYGLFQKAIEWINNNQDLVHDQEFMQKAIGLLTIADDTLTDEQKGIK